MPVGGQCRPLSAIRQLLLHCSNSGIPAVAMASDFASGGRVPLTGHPWPAAESARSLAPTLRALSSTTRRATGGSGGAASGNCSLRCSTSGNPCRRLPQKQSNSSRTPWVEPIDFDYAVQGCTDSWTNAPFAVPSIAGDGEVGPKGRAHDARASAAVHGGTVRRPRRRREAQGILPRTRRGKTPRWALAFLVTFWAMPKSNRLARRARRSSALEQGKDQHGFPLARE